MAIFLASGAGLAVRLFMASDAAQFYDQLDQLPATEPEHSVQKKHVPKEHTKAKESKPDDGAARLSDQVSALSRKYPAIAAWIQIPDSALDYPVMLGEDNQFYLDHLPDGSKNLLGSLFFDYRCRKSSFHLIIYGHNGSKGRMFGMLKNYETQEYYLSHPFFILAVPDAQYICRIFSVRRVKADSDAYTLDFENADAFAQYIRQAMSDAAYPTHVRCQDQARIVTLSTCTGWGNERLIVQAFLQ